MQANFTMSISVFLTSDKEGDLVTGSKEELKGIKAIATQRLTQLMQGTSLTASPVKGGAESGSLWATVRCQCSDDGYDTTWKISCNDVAESFATTENISKTFNPNRCDWFEFGDESIAVRGLSFSNR